MNLKTSHRDQFGIKRKSISAQIEIKNMSTLKAMEEQKINRVFENTEFYMKPIVETDF